MVHLLKDCKNDVSVAACYATCTLLLRIDNVSIETQK